MVDLPIHDHSYYKSAYNGDELGHVDKGLVENSLWPLENVPLLIIVP